MWLNGSSWRVPTLAWRISAQLERIRVRIPGQMGHPGQRYEIWCRNHGCPPRTFMPRHRALSPGHSFLGTIVTLSRPRTIMSRHIYVRRGHLCLGIIVLPPMGGTLVPRIQCPTLQIRASIYNTMKSDRHTYYTLHVLCACICKRHAMIYT